MRLPVERGRLRATSAPVLRLGVLLTPLAAAAIALLPWHSAGATTPRETAAVQAAAAPAARTRQASHRAAPATDARHQDVVASKVIGMRSVGGGDAGYWVGTGLVFEHEFAVTGLQLEVSWASLHGDHGGSVVPIDLLVKWPVRIGPHVDLFVGLGPALQFRPGAASQLAGGAIASGGGWLWVSEHIGLLVEIDYAVMLAEQTTHELELAMGVAVRFH